VAIVRIEVGEPTSGLAKLAAARGWQAGRRVSALALDGERPATYMADEVIVDAGDRDLIERMREAGARVVRDATDPELPEEFRRGCRASCSCASRRSPRPARRVSRTRRSYAKSLMNSMGVVNSRTLLSGAQGGYGFRRDGRRTDRKRTTLAL
jgi:hypothetical protein